VGVNPLKKGCYTSLSLLSVFISYCLISTYSLQVHRVIVTPDHIHTHTLGRVPLDEGSARRRDFYLTTHNTL